MVDSLVKISAIKPDSAKLHNLSPSEVIFCEYLKNRTPKYNEQ